MTENQIRVDILALEDFQTRLASRLQDVDAMLAKFDTHLCGDPPRLGAFADARTKAERYTALVNGYVDRVNRVRAAIVAAQTAAATIIANYRTAEAVNAASTAKIAAATGDAAAPTADIAAHTAGTDVRTTDIADRLGGVARAFNRGQ